MRTPNWMAGVGYKAFDRIKARIPVDTRGAIQLRRVGLRRATARLRMLPQLLIIGGQRCGTSSFYAYLGRHPAVVASLRKETDYFSVAHWRGQSWYQAHYPLKARGTIHRLAGRDLLTFEASPEYLLDPRAADRAAALVPHSSIMALLRNPVDRAYSQYLHNLRLGFETLEFEAALDAEEGRTAGEVERLLADPKFEALNLRRFGYVARGRYADQVSSWLGRYPAERVLIVRSEDFYSDPAAVLAQVLDFLGLAPWQPVEFRNYSYATQDAKPTKSMEPAVRRRLEEIFLPHNQRLYQLIDRDMGWEAN